MRNRIRSITRWPLDKVARSQVAETEIAFFRVMKDLIGERFVTPSTMQRYQSAIEIKRNLQAERVSDELED